MLARRVAHRGEMAARNVAAIFNIKACLLIAHRRLEMFSCISSLHSARCDWLARAAVPTCRPRITWLCRSLPRHQKYLPICHRWDGLITKVTDDINNASVMKNTNLKYSCKSEPATRQLFVFFFLSVTAGCAAWHMAHS